MVVVDSQTLYFAAEAFGRTAWALAKQSLAGKGEAALGKSTEAFLRDCSDQCSCSVFAETLFPSG